MSSIQNIIKNINKYRKNSLKYNETLKSFIKEFEMNIQFNIHNNIYDPFVTIHQIEENKNGNIMKFIRHFYYYDESMEDIENLEDDGEEEDFEEDENDVQYDDDIDTEEKDKKGNVGKIHIKITPIYANKKEQKIKNKKDSLEIKKENKENKIQKKQSVKKDEKNVKEGKRNKNFPLLLNYSKKITKPKRYVDFNQDITFYYYIANDKNEFCEEYGYENCKLKYYEGTDLDDKSLDDAFMEHCDELHSMEKAALTLTNDYFDHEFMLFNLFTIENKKLENKNKNIKLGDFFKKLWIQNSNISSFDSYINYIQNRFILVDKFIKLNSQKLKKNNEENNILEIMQQKINKELDMDLDIMYYLGKLDLDFGINNSNFTENQIQEIGKFLKIIFVFLNILNRTVALTDEEEEQNVNQEDDFYNELRFYDILESEKGEFEEVFENLSESIESFFDSDIIDSNKDSNQLVVIKEDSLDSINPLEVLPNHIKHFYKNDLDAILFGIRMKLWNEYMEEYLNKMYYDKSFMKKSQFIKYYDEYINDIKILISHKYDNKILENILIKWEEFKNINSLYTIIVGNIINLR